MVTYCFSLTAPKEVRQFAIRLLKKKINTQTVALIQYLVSYLLK